MLYLVWICSVYIFAAGIGLTILTPPFQRLWKLANTLAPPNRFHSLSASAPFPQESPPASSHIPTLGYTGYSNNPPAQVVLLSAEKLHAGYTSAGLFAVFSLVFGIFMLLKKQRKTLDTPVLHSPDPFICSTKPTTGIFSRPSAGTCAGFISEACPNTAPDGSPFSEDIPMAQVDNDTPQSSLKISPVQLVVSPLASPAIARTLCTPPPPSKHRPLTGKLVSCPAPDSPDNYPPMSPLSPSYYPPLSPPSGPSDLLYGAFVDNAPELSPIHPPASPSPLRRGVLKVRGKIPDFNHDRKSDGSQNSKTGHTRKTILFDQQESEKSPASGSSSNITVDENKKRISQITKRSPRKNLPSDTGRRDDRSRHGRLASLHLPGSAQDERAPRSDTRTLLGEKVGEPVDQNGTASSETSKRDDRSRQERSGSVHPHRMAQDELALRPYTRRLLGNKLKAPHLEDDTAFFKTGRRDDRSRPGSSASTHPHGGEAPRPRFKRPSGKSLENSDITSTPTPRSRLIPNRPYPKRAELSTPWEVLVSRLDLHPRAAHFPAPFEHVTEPVTPCINTDNPGAMHAEGHVPEPPSPTPAEPWASPRSDSGWEPYRPRRGVMPVEIPRPGEGIPRYSPERLARLEATFRRFPHISFSAGINTEDQSSTLQEGMQSAVQTPLKRNHFDKRNGRTMT